MSFIRDRLDALASGDSLPARFIRGSFWSLIGAGVTQGLGVAISVILGRLLGKTGFGELGMIQGTIGLFGIFAGMGLSLTATKHIAEYRTGDPERAGRIAGMCLGVTAVTSILASVLLVVFSPYVSSRMINAPHLCRELQLGCVMLFFNSLFSVQIGSLAGLEAFKTITQISIFRGLLGFPVVIAGVYLWGLMGAMISFAFMSVIGWYITHLALNREAGRAGVQISYRRLRPELSILWTFSLPVFLSGAMVGPISWLTGAMLVNQPKGYAEMGAFDAVMRIKQVPEIIIGSLLAPLVPILSELYGRRDHSSYRQMLFWAFALSFGGIVPLALVQTAFPSVTLYLYGREYLNHGAVVQWLMLQTVLVGATLPVGPVLASMNRMWFGWCYNLFWSIIYLGLSYPLISRYQAAGMAAAYALTHWATIFPCVLYVRRHEGQYLTGVPLLFLILVSLAVFGVCFWASTQTLPMAAVVGIGASIGSMLLARYLRRVEAYLPKPTVGVE